MATTQQKLFARWAEMNYHELAKLMPLRDMMHSAFLTVYGIKRPVIPTPERFLSLMDDAYHRHILEEFNHAMHYTLPDPSFWKYLDEDEQQSMLHDECAPNTPSRSISDLSAYSLQKLFSFVKSNFSERDFSIFKKAVVERMTYANIAKVHGIGRSEVRRVISNIENAIRSSKFKSPKL